MSDAELVSSVLAGNTARFEALVDRYLPMVRALCASHVYTEAVHDDLVQETFVESYLKLNTLRRPDRFGPWLAQIARHKCQSWLRREGSKQRAMDWLAHEPAPPKDPISEMARSELRAWVHATVQRLPVKTREAVLLYYLEGYSVAETARCLDVREGAVKKRLQYGRELLGHAVREHLGRQPEEQSKREGQKKRVLAALPLGAAPWLKTGTAAAATGVAATTASGLGVSTVVLYTISALAVAAVAIGGWHLFVPEAPPAQSDRSDQSDPSDASEANLALARPTREAKPVAPEATGDLRVKVHYQVSRPQPISPSRYCTVDEEGPPVAGAVVAIVPWKSEEFVDTGSVEGPRREAVSDAQGSARFDNLPTGPYAVRAWTNRDKVDANRDSRLWDRHIVNVEENQETVLSLCARDFISRIEGTVVHAATGKPVPHARVFLNWEAPGVSGGSTHANDEGWFAFTGDPFCYGAYEVRLDAVMGGCAVKGVRKPGEPVWIELKAQGATVSGKVFTHDGKPAPDEIIWRDSAEGGSFMDVATSDEHGAYVFYHDGGILKLRAGSGAAATALLTVELEPEEAANVDFTLKPFARVYLDIRDDMGAVPAEFTQEALIETQRLSAAYGGITRKTGDYYVIPYVAPGHYIYTGRTKAGATGDLEFDIPEVLGEYRFAMSVAKPDNDLVIRVQDTRYQPAAGVHVSMQRVFRHANGQSEGFFFGQNTDHNGICCFEGLLPGEYMIGCEGIPTQVHIPWQKRISLTINASPQQSPEGLHLREGTIVLVDGTRDRTRLSTEHCALYVLAPSGQVGHALEVGVNTLYFVKPGYTVGVGELYVTHEQWKDLTQPGSAGRWRERVELVLGEEGGISGSVTDKRGNPIAGAGIRVLPLEVWRHVEGQEYPWRNTCQVSDVSGLARMLAQNARTDADGAFRLRYLAPGYYVVGAQVDDAWAVSEPVEVLAGHETGPVVLQALEGR